MPFTAVPHPTRRAPRLLAAIVAGAATIAAAAAASAPAGATVIGIGGRAPAGATVFAVGHDASVHTTIAEPSASGFYIRGGGDGHGIGMSQYGTLGYAQHGWDYQRILAHYYEGTAIGSVSTSRVVTVLLQDGAASFSGATKAGGDTLEAGTSYAVEALASGKLELLASGKKVADFSSPLTVSGSGPLRLAGLGEYHGSFVFRPDGAGGVETVNAVDIEDYVRGVVSAEMPASWPAQALDAQAVAARTYALTSGPVSSTYDLYSDARSQMYLGVAAETAATNAAVNATRGQVVTYHGTPVVTYFFSSSGGHTESIQNVWLGATPEPWLRGVPDPYDAAGGNPYHRWAFNLSVTAAARDLSGLVKGSLVGIEVLAHGVSPRIVSAAVVGSKGSTDVTGPQLQQLFGLMSTYVAFTTITTRGVFSSSTGTSGEDSSGGGGTSAGSASAGSTGTSGTSGRSLAGRVFPTRRGVLVLVQELGDHGWRTRSRVRTVDGGRFTAKVPGPGRYRITYGGVGGPAITVH